MYVCNYLWYDTQHVEKYRGIGKWVDGSGSVPGRQLNVQEVMMKKQVRPIPLQTTKSLGAEIARIEGAQIRMQQANAALKRGDDALLMTLGLPDDLLADLKQRFLCKGAGYPAYLLRNNRQTLRMLKEQEREQSQQQSVLAP